MLESVIRLALGVLVSFVAMEAWSETRYWDLQDGRVVRFDQESGRAEVYGQDGAAPLWDGTHRTSDGSVLIVRDGVVLVQGRQPPIANKPGNTSEESPPLSVPNPGEEAACVRLAIKSCGFDGACGESQGCSAARQLVALEKDESWARHAPKPNHTTMQCQQALENESFFPPCTQVPSHEEATQCEQLVASSCGTAGQCQLTRACDAARQLLSLEMEERIEKSRRPERRLLSSENCQNAFNDDYFPPCDNEATTVPNPRPTSR